jgi:hypothetical protein
MGGVLRCALSLLSFDQIAAARDAVVKKPQEENIGSIILLADLTVRTQLWDNHV